MQHADAYNHILLVTGPSGAGRTSAIRALEDIRFEVIDNLPLRLIAPLMDTPERDAPMALGIDPRTRDFSVQAIEDALETLSLGPNTKAELLFVDCDTRVLLQRFSETRRRHPLAHEGQLDVAIARELEMLAPLRARADHTIDTSNMTIHDLRAAIETRFAPAGKGQMIVSVQSFSYKKGAPGAVDLMFDCRFLRNPHWSASLRALNGCDAAVQRYIKEDVRYAEFEKKVRELCAFLLPAHQDEGKSHLSIAFGCTGGQHRSVALAEALGADLAKSGWPVSIRHRELNARGVQRKNGS